MFLDRFLMKLAGLLLLSCATFLSGCGTDESHDSNVGNLGGADSGQSAVTYSAQDTIRLTSFVDTYYVNLSDNISSSDGSISYLQSVKPLSENDDCKILSTTESGFSVSATNPNVCNYIYTVDANLENRLISYPNENSAGSASAIVSVLIGENTELLMPISAATSVGSTVLIDPPLEQLAYGEPIGPSYFLSGDASIPTSASTGSSIVVNESDQTISYTPGEGFQGLERILYSFTDGVNVKMGTIDIAVSSSSNIAPTASNFYFHYNDNYSTPNGQDVYIDVKEYIDDADTDDTLQLIGVYAYDVTLTIPEDANSDGDYYNDTQFVLNSDEPGPLSVTYVVTDKRGGFAVGVIKLTIANVYPPIFAQVGDNPNDGDDHWFSPPYTVEQAENVGIKYVPGDEGNGTQSLDGLQTATHERDIAAAICDVRGEDLPTSDELLSLYEAYPDGAIFSSDSSETVDFHWPIDQNYWASDSSSVDLGTGHIEPSNADNALMYVACISHYIYRTEISGPTNISLNVYDPDGTAEYSMSVFYTDGSTELIDSSSVDWTIIVDDPSLLSSGAFVPDKSNGKFDYFPSKNQMMASSDTHVHGCVEEGICSEFIVSTSVCNTLSTCLDIFDTGSGKLFTNTPSVTYLYSIGLTYTSHVTFLGTAIPLYTLAGANALCNTYNTLSLGGRTNWRLTTRDELVTELYGTFGRMFTARGWPDSYFYWTSRNFSTNANSVARVDNGQTSLGVFTSGHLVSCVSDP